MVLPLTVQKPQLLLQGSQQLCSQVEEENRGAPQQHLLPAMRASTWRWHTDECRHLQAHLLGVGLELGGGGVLQRHSQGGDLVVVGAALERREHREVDAVLKVVGCALGLALHPPAALGALHASCAAVRRAA